MTPDAIDQPRWAAPELSVRDERRAAGKEGKFNQSRVLSKGAAEGRCAEYLFVQATWAGPMGRLALPPSRELLGCSCGWPFDRCMAGSALQTACAAIPRNHARSKPEGRISLAHLFFSASSDPQPTPNPTFHPQPQEMAMTTTMTTDRRRRLPGFLIALPLALVHLPQPARAQFGDLVPNPLSWMLSPWPYHCQAPVPLGQPCIEDYDCDASRRQHCHLTERVCAVGQPEGSSCDLGNGA